MVSVFEKLIFTLDVTRSGAAASKGLVTDPVSSGRINCGVDCSDTWSYGDVVTLTANANGNIFAGWNYGSCGTALTWYPTDVFSQLQNAGDGHLVACLPDGRCARDAGLLGH